MINGNKLLILLENEMQNGIYNMFVLHSNTYYSSSIATRFVVILKLSKQAGKSEFSCLFIVSYTMVVVYSRDHKGVGVAHEIISRKKK